MRPPKGVRRAKCASTCRGFRSPLASANARRSSSENRSWCTCESALDGGNLFTHELLERPGRLLPEQRLIGKADGEAGLERVDEPNVRERVPTLDRARSVVVADLEVPSEHVLERLVEAPIEFRCGAHGRSSM